MFKIAVLASTSGTDLQAIIDEMKADKMEGVELVLVASNKECKAIERAKEQGYETFVAPKQNRDLELRKVLLNKKVDLICLVGYMRILDADFVKEFEGKIINVHPAIDMKKYAGPGAMNLNVHKAVLKNNEKESGCTIHYVTEGVDEGPVIAQADVVVSEDETPESLKIKVQAQEKLLYPEVIRRFARGDV